MYFTVIMVNWNSVGILTLNLHWTLTTGIIIHFPFQLLDVDPQDAAEEEGANVDLDSQRKGKCAVIKTSTRQVRDPISSLEFF